MACQSPRSAFSYSQIPPQVTLTSPPTPGHCYLLATEVQYVIFVNNFLFKISISAVHDFVISVAFMQCRKF